MNLNEAIGNERSVNWQAIGTAQEGKLFFFVKATSTTLRPMMMMMKKKSNFDWKSCDYWITLINCTFNWRCCLMNPQETQNQNS